MFQVSQLSPGGELKLKEHFEALKPDKPSNTTLTVSHPIPRIRKGIPT